MTHKITIGAFALVIAIGLPVFAAQAGEITQNEAVKIQIRADEGVKTRVERDRLGFLTVGVGHKVVPKDKLKAGDVIGPARIHSLFEQDFRIATDGAQHILQKIGPQPREVRSVLTNMVFQMGLSGVKKFDGFLAALKAGDFQRAAQEMLFTNGKPTPWMLQTPSRAMRLARVIRGLQ